ncbi:efflux RND transporter periplasmic adaptor subunit [Fulvivirga sedimenti]|uniref:Efflux RND transporter periplasmic adaptor subunit n=1 Tax=Fulvivirga sedimenti TaxID=2879465 RepID=A0A9X1KXG1_9BACT|nr:efflux RND transporter periplasmic adaptor subunit [Fulvivirga sedimenti]MCA6074698.1 efflux RND transporter periplasmic adaptor subunit [Fulvivirga sedimenti]MCA6075875.1 efflux RND transporter periplasmic adaptor subunit [Fulvivirga sedimenti]MCA6077003.1 efflux RND transporter periplasmic adaptor subunit [Fulvivirga sedimenti]
MKYGTLLFILILASCGPQNGEPAKSEPAGIIPATQDLSFNEEQLAARNLKIVQPDNFNFGNYVRVNGYIDVPPEGRASVSAFYGGYVKRLELIPGQTIKKGEILMSLENPEYLEMQQEYLSTLDQMTYLSDDYERQKTLMDENITSKKSFLKAESEYLNARARLEALRQKLTMLGISVSDVTSGKFTPVVHLRSPISGHITEVQAVIGQYLPPAQPAVSIVNSDHIHLELQVFEKDLTNISIGQPIRMRLPSAGDTTTYHASVYLVGKNISGDNRIALVHAHLNNESDEEKLTPGMYIEADILISEEIKPSLPAQAIRRSGDQAYILASDDEKWPKTFRRMEIRIGKETDSHTEILSELEPNLWVLTGTI